MTKAQMLLQAMNDIDDAFLLEAEETLAQQKKPRKIPFKWFVIVLAILGLSSGAYAAIQWDSVFLAYFKPSVTLIEKLEGNVQNVDAVSDCETLILKVNQTIGDESTIYLNLEVSLPDGQTWRDVLPKELTEGEEILSLNPERYEFYSGEFQYEDVKEKTEEELTELLKGHAFGPGTGGGKYSDIVLDSSSAQYFLYSSFHYDILNEKPITLYIPYFNVADNENDCVLHGPFVISWFPENRGAQYAFKIDDANGTVGEVKITPFKIYLKLYGFGQTDEYALANNCSENILIQYKNGTDKTVSSLTNDLSGWTGDAYLEYTIRFRTLLDLDTVESIQVGPYICELE